MLRISMIARLAMGIMVCTGLALADYSLDFTIPAGAGGTISYTSGNPVTGTGITVSSVFSPGGGSLTCTSCILSFTSGAYTGSTSFSGTTILGFGSGGTFTLNGSINGGSTFSNLLTGNFDSTTITESSSGFDIDNSFFSTAIDPALTSYFGLPSTPPNYSGALTILFFASGDASGFTSSSIFSGNIGASVPEPATIILLGTVLLGCVALARRRMA